MRGIPEAKEWRMRGQFSSDHIRVVRAVLGQNRI